MIKNEIMCGDNLELLQELIMTKEMSGKVDLVYIDPPFATDLVFKIGGERTSTISPSKNDKIAYKDLIKGQDFLNFLKMRLILLKILMSEKASIYLHIDYKIGHYVKILMDEIFGVENFRGDITRVKCNPKNFKRKGYGNVKDMILFYSKSDKMTWNEPFIDFTEEEIKRNYPKTDSNGRKYTTIPLHAPGEVENGSTSLPFKGVLPPVGRHWRTNIEILEEWEAQGLIEWSKNGNPRKRIYFDETNGKRVQDIWTDFKDPQYPVYPTEKNSDMLELIVKTSSNEGDLVLDCFCGSGTSLKAAQKLGRNFLGIDSSEEAIKTAKQKLKL